jgi:hypothetical protein
MQKVLKPNAVNRRFGAVVERSPAARKVFTVTERASKERLFGCRMCGQCALPVTGYSCPMGCPKELRNGPCGGVGPGGACEVYPDSSAPPAGARSLTCASCSARSTTAGGGKAPG